MHEPIAGCAVNEGNLTVLEDPALAKVNFSHSTGFCGGVRHRSAKASRGEDLEVEEPVLGWVVL
jgi:hypothetical protein